MTYRIKSAPICVGYDDKALNCYWPMPFYKHCRITLENTAPRAIRRVFYNIDYEKGPLPRGLGLFHAEFRSIHDLPPQHNGGNLTGADNYTILWATGTGRYVGCCLFVDAQPGGWWGEGDDMMQIDGEPTPRIIGTGSEDYFCDAWGFDEAYNYPHYGVPLLDVERGQRSRISCYRFHIPDPVHFQKSIRVSIEHLYGSGVKNDYSSVAYWYQDQPNTSRPPLPSGANFEPRPRPETLKDSYSLDGTELEAPLRGAGVDARSITTGYRAASGGGYLELPLNGQTVTLNLPVAGPGRYDVRLVPYGVETTATLRLQDGKAVDVAKGEKRVDLSTAEATGKSLTLTVTGTGKFGIDRIEIHKQR